MDHVTIQLESIPLFILMFGGCPVWADSTTIGADKRLWGEGALASFQENQCSEIPNPNLLSVQISSFKGSTS